ncbi:C-C motif chemokine 21 [Heteronotia binoei]|uniref:C-C motif chemokine 21 n=1 Tax=Heteronotia binoei TaxID=13085 RepID=UPI0029306A5B|nr:C-C motif chemokine 21 [Heteronotia binoei]
MALFLRRPLQALALLAGALCVLLAARGDAEPAQDCCLRLPPQPQPFSRKMQNQLISYRFQGPQMGCQREAIVFITKKGRELCISPEANWAPELMRKIDAKIRKARTNQ